MIKDVEKFLNADGTISARKIRGSLGSRRNRKEGSKCCRRPGSRKPMKAYAKVAIKQRHRDVVNARLALLLAPTASAES